MTVRRLLAAAAAALVITGVWAGPASARLSFQSVVTQFMCVSCHEPLNQVSSAQAVSEKQTLRGLIGRDLTLAQVKAAMVAQYGPQVLGQPPASGFNLTIYVLPPAAFLAGLAVLAVTLPRWRRRSPRSSASLPAGPVPLRADDARRLDDELTNFI